MRSLRARLILWTATATALALAICGIAVYLAIRAALLWEFDAALTNKARAIASMVEVDEGKLIVELFDWQLPEFNRGQRPEYFQVTSDHGISIARSTSLAGRDLPHVQGLPVSPVIKSVALPDGRRGRLLSMSVQPRL